MEKSVVLISALPAIARMITCLDIRQCKPAHSSVINKGGFQ